MSFLFASSRDKFAADSHLDVYLEMIVSAMFSDSSSESCMLYTKHARCWMWIRSLARPSKESSASLSALGAVAGFSSAVAPEGPDHDAFPDIRESSSSCAYLIFFTNFTIFSGSARSAFVQSRLPMFTQHVLLSRTPRERNERARGTAGARRASAPSRHSFDLLLTR